jgi:hypothetical protein
MLTEQALLFTALGVFWDKNIYIGFLIFVIGFFSSISIGYSLYLANESIGQLIDHWIDYKKNLELEIFHQFLDLGKIGPH